MLLVFNNLFSNLFNKYYKNLYEFFCLLISIASLTQLPINSEEFTKFIFSKFFKLLNKALKEYQQQLFLSFFINIYV